MLGRLLSSAISANTPQGANTQAQGVEDDYTRGLLYPNVFNDLSTSHSLSNLSDQLSVSDNNRNVRIIVAQDGSGGEQKAIIYDTDPVVTWNDYRLKDRSNDRCANGALSPDIRNRRRSAALGSPGMHGPNEDEMKVLMECMFGSSVLAYKGPSIKFHVLPSAPPTVGRAPPIRRHSSKTSSFSRTDPLHHDTSIANTDKSSRSVLITRTFSVLVPLPQFPEATSKAVSNVQSIVSTSKKEATTAVNASQIDNKQTEMKGFPFPALQNPSSLKQPRPQKSITYAVALIITIPGPSMPTNTPLSQTKKTTSENTNPQDIPRNSSQSSFWGTREESSEGLIDDRMDIITKNWDVITRALCEMQVILAKQILEALKKRLIMSPSLVQNPYSYKTILLPGALMNDRIVITETDRMRWRVVSGFKIPRVMTGQGRWGAWRDEAKWAGQSFGGRDNHFFFLTLLTAFLGCHTDWLDILGPRDYRRKHKQRQVMGKEDANIRSRTIIVCDDKIAARKLVYLLSAFLPSRSPPTTHWNADRQHAFLSTGLNEDTLNFSQSPPQTRNDVKKEIRRIPSKLSIVEGVNENKASSSWNIPSSSSAVSMHHATDDSPKAEAILSSSVSSRKQLPIPVLSPQNYNSTITTAAATPQATVLSSSFKYHDGENRPGSSSSSISVNNLRQTLRRNGTGPSTGYGNESSGSNGWGSFISSIWSNPRSRGSFSGASSASTTADDIGHIDARLGSRKVEDEFSTIFASPQSDSHDDTRLHGLGSPRWGPDTLLGHNFEENTLKYSVDEEGIIDVDIPMGAHAGFSSDKSFGFSPANSSPTSASQFESSMESSLISLSALTLLPPLPPASGESESTGNVAGEVDRFHPDFILQAVKPYTGLERDIRKAMKAEPIPLTSHNHENKSDNEWVDVCVTLIADTNKNQIRSLKLRRKRRDITSTPTLNNATAEIRPASQETYNNDYFQEEIVEEIVMDMDEALATAVEGVVSNTVPVGALTCNSRSSSVTSGRSRTRTPQYEKSASLLPPRECRAIVLGALEKVAQQVLDQPKGLVHNILTEGIASWLREIENGGMV